MKVTIVGAYGGHNLGDEAILEALVPRLFDSLPLAEISLLCDIPKCRQSAQENHYAQLGLKALDKRSLRDSIHGALADVLVIGGGQLIFPGPRRQHLWLATLILLNRLGGGTSFALGIGVESLASFSSRYFARAFLPLARQICVRDRRSFDMLRRESPRLRNIAETADIVFTNLRDVPPTPDESTPTLSLARILVSVDATPETFPTSRFEWLRIVTSLKKQFPESELVIAGQDRRFNFDAALVTSIEEEFIDEVTISRPSSVEDLSELIASVDLVVSRRMHPLILGLILSKRVVAVGPSPKVAQLCQQLNAHTLTLLPSSDSHLDAIELLPDQDALKAIKILAEGNFAPFRQLACDEAGEPNQSFRAVRSRWNRSRPALRAPQSSSVSSEHTDTPTPSSNSGRNTDSAPRPPRVVPH